jgi:hypothetical protein
MGKVEITRPPVLLPPLKRRRIGSEDRREASFILTLIILYLIAIFVLLPLLIHGKLS